MQMILDVPEYNSENGIRLTWQDGFTIVASANNGVLIVTANKAGLISLATQLLTLAQDEIPLGYHLHYDDGNSLEEGSNELVIQKM